MTDSNVRAELVSASPQFDPARLATMGFLAGYGDRTRETYAGDLRAWAAWCDRNHVPILEAQRAHVDLWMREVEKIWMPGTIARRLSTISGLYAYCIDEGLLVKNPVARVRRPKVSMESSTLGLDRTEMIQFLTAARICSPVDHAMACLLGLNGLRASEICHTRIETMSVERGHRTILVPRKGGKNVRMPVAPPAARALDLVIGERHAGPIFQTSIGTDWDRMEVYRRVRKIARRAGFTKRIHPHSLRHSFVTAALDAGVPLRDVQEAASHADPRTTMRYDRGRVSLDRHATYIVSAFVAGN